MKKRRRSRGSAAPIYIFIASWLICSLALPLYSISGLIAALLISGGIGVLVGSVMSSSRRKKEAMEEAEERRRQAEEAAKNPPKAPEKSYGPEVDKIIADGKIAMREMGRLYRSIPDPNIKAKINELMRISDKIVQDAIEDPSDVPQIRKFLDYYLPTTIKLLHAYDRMVDQGIEGKNLSKSIQSIEDMLDTAIDAYKKQLDSLFENQALDIETDISVMNQMLAREGLTGDSEFDELIAKAAAESSGSAGQTLQL